MVEVTRQEDLFSFLVNECRLSPMVPEEGPYIMALSCTLGVLGCPKWGDLFLYSRIEHPNRLLHARTPVSISLIPAEYVPLSVNPDGSFPFKEWEAVLIPILKAFINCSLPCSNHPVCLPVCLWTPQSNGGYKNIKTCYWAFSVASYVIASPWTIIYLWRNRKERSFQLSHI